MSGGWGKVKRDLVKDGQIDRLKPIEYVPATKAANSVSGTNAALIQREAMKKERLGNENSESGAKVGRFSGGKINLKYADSDSTDEQAMTVKAAKANDNLFVPTNVVRSTKWKKMSRAGPGLYNQGNTCFLNSTLQCLLHCAPLAQPLCDANESKAILRGMDAGKQGTRFIIQHFHGLANEFWGGRGGKVAAIRANSMVSTIRRVGKQFRPMRQEDAHEYLRQLVDCMHEEVLKVHGVKLSDGRIAETTFISRVFGGKLCSELKCSKCKYTSRTFNFFQDLSLEVSGNINSVEQAIGAFLKPEVLTIENAWKCDGCKKPVQATKQMSISELPNVLVLHLKRFTYGRGKMSKHVDFPISMHLSVKKCGDSEDAVRAAADPISGSAGSKRYHLSGVVVHHGGSSHSGHYVAYVHGPNGQWYEMNDSMVSAVSVKKVLKQQAYILFYTGTAKNADKSSTEKIGEEERGLFERRKDKMEEKKMDKKLTNDVGVAMDGDDLAKLRKKQAVMLKSAREGELSVAAAQQQQKRPIRDDSDSDSDSSMSDGSDFDSADYVDEYQMSSDDEAAEGDSDDVDDEGETRLVVAKSRVKPSLGGISPMRFPFLQGLKRFFQWGKMSPRSSSTPLTIAQLREEARSPCPTVSDVALSKLPSNNDHSDSDSVNDSSSVSDSSSEADDDEDDDDDDNDDAMHIGSESSPLDSEDRDVEEHMDQVSSGDIKGALVKQARRSRSTASEGQWDDVDEDVLAAKEAAERAVKKEYQKARGSKRPSTWDAHLDSGRLKKTKSDKEEAKGVHDSFLSEEGKRQKTADIKKRKHESNLGDTTVNFFQQMSDRRKEEKKMASEGGGGESGGGDRGSQQQHEGKYRKDKDNKGMRGESFKDHKKGGGGDRDRSGYGGYGGGGGGRGSGKPSFKGGKPGTH
jgi:ubiquitin C-terminal hydrolase